MQLISEAIVVGSLEEIAKREELEKRAAQVREELGPRARVVAPYKPNRKQRRAQEAVKRAMHKEDKK